MGLIKFHLPTRFVSCHKLLTAKIQKGLESRCVQSVSDLSIREYCPLCISKCLSNKILVENPKYNKWYGENEMAFSMEKRLGEQERH